jgi:hypothetical protein
MRRALWSVSAVVAILVTACASATTAQPGGTGHPGTSGLASTVLTPGDPLRLVGLWQLDAPGQPAGSALRLGDDLTIWSRCGYLSGDWRADAAGLFVGLAFGGSAGCVGGMQGDPTPTWLTRVVSFKADASGAQLLDSTGAVVATLRPGGHPTPGPDIATELAQQPAVTDSLRARLRPVAPLPAGLVAARPDQLIGRWISPAKPTLRGFAELAADGSWKGSDGANGQGGRWSAAPDGELVVAAGAQTLAGCVPDACANVGSWFASASRAAFDGPTLVLLDADGRETGRAVRTATPIASAAVSASSASVGSDSGPIPDGAFRVAAPILDAAAGPGPGVTHRPCQPPDVTATAQTRPTAAGVAGVVELVGDHCSLHVYPGPTALLDVNGQRLAVPLARDRALVNPAGNQRPDLPLAAGIAAWGFAWRGPWCGPAAISVVVALGDDPAYGNSSGSTGDVVAKLTGPAPACKGRSDAELVPGVPGQPTEPTLTPPADWAGLRATLTLSSTTDGRTLSAIVVELRNTTATPIAISPCPDYALDVDSSVSGGTAMDAGGGELPCAQQAGVIPPNATMRYRLGARSYDPGGSALKGTVVTARFAIAGIATTSASARVS